MRKALVVVWLLFASCCFSQSDYWELRASKPVFTTTEQPKITVGFGGQSRKLSVQVFYFPTDVATQIGKSKIKPKLVATLNPKLRSKGKRTYTVSEFVVPVNQPGWYKVYAGLGKAKAETEFWISNIGLVAKGKAGGAVIWVVDRITNKPVPNATISYIDSEGYRVQSGITDSNGLQELKLSEKSRTVEARIGQHYSVLNLYENSAFNPTSIYLYTDRPIYRPGQTVYIKGIARHVQNGDYQNAPNEKVDLTVKDNSDVVIYQQSLTTNSNGTFNSELKLPDQGAVGEYSVTAEFNQIQNQAYFSISEYRKPEYRLDVTMVPNMVITGDPLVARVEAKYYFGGGVKGAVVEWYAYVRESYSDWASFASRSVEDSNSPFWETPSTDDESDYGDGGYGEVRLEGKATTNADGIALIQLPSRFKGHTYTRPVTMEVNVTLKDVAGREKDDTTSATILPAQRFVVLTTEDYVIAPDKTVGILVRSYNAIPSQAISAQVHVDVYRTWWAKEKNKWVEKRSKANTPSVVTTDTNGKYRIAFTPRKAGSYRIFATITDGRGRQSTSNDYLWVTGDQGELAWADESHGLDVIVNRKELKVGEPLRILIKTAPESADVWFSLEGNANFESRIVKTHNHEAVIEIPIENRFLPNLYIWAGYVRNGKLAQRVQLVMVHSPTRLLNVSVTSDKPEYLPRETAVYTIETRDLTGSPVSAEVSMGVVDEAIYALARDRATDIRTFYYGPQYNRISTAISPSLEYFVKTRLARVKESKISRDVRKNFKDTAFWTPTVLTNEEGRAQISVTLPDNLTEWRATVRAVTSDTAVGQTTQSIKANKPLIAQLELPRFVVQGDEFHVIGVVRNTTPSPITVDIEIAMEGDNLKLNAPLKQTLTVSPGSDQRIDWPTTATATGPAIITLSAQSDQYDDSMQLPLQVQPYSNMRFKVNTGVTATGASGTFEIPSDSNPRINHYELHLAPSLLSLAFDAADALYAYPYGCIEQTTSPVYANLALLDAINSMKFERPEFEAKLKEAVRVSIKRIRGMEGYDGGWGWGTYSETDTYWTAYVIQALTNAERAGFTIDRYSLGRGMETLARLTKQIDVNPPVKSKFKKKWQYEIAVAKMRWNLHEKARALNVLVDRDPQTYTSAILRLYDREDELSNTGKTYLIKSLIRIGANDKALEILNDLKKVVKGSGVNAYWKSESDIYWYFGEGDAFVTASILQCFLKLTPDDPIIDRGIYWLTLQREGRMWVSTNDTAQVVRTIALYSRIRGQKPFLGNASIMLNGQVVKEINFTPDSAFQAEQVIVADKILLKEGQNQWGFNLNGEGTMRYASMARYSIPIEQNVQEVHGLRIERTYLKQIHVPVKQGKGRDAYIDETFKFVPFSGQAKAGDEIAVKIVVNSATKLRHVLIEDPIPAGLEPINEEESRYMYEGLRPDYSSDEMLYGYAQIEYHDDRTAVLVETLPEGKQVYYYLLRAVTPGIFRAAPTKAYQMYMPDWRGSGRSNRLTVQK